MGAVLENPAYGARVPVVRVDRQLNAGAFARPNTHAGARNSGRGRVGVGAEDRRPRGCGGRFGAAGSYRVCCAVL